MSKEEIPTRELIIGSGETQKKIKVYKWLTQEEEDEYQNLLMGNQDLDFSATGQKGEKNSEVKATVSYANVSKARRYLIECMCINLTWDQFNIWVPDDRDELFNKLRIVRDLKKK